MPSCDSKGSKNYLILDKKKHQICTYKAIQKRCLLQAKEKKYGSNYYVLLLL
jgi:hypothetical protein